ncbi:MAG: hypothetical protein ABW277_27865 [Longimicrobiaceae bacterium]
MRFNDWDGEPSRAGEARGARAAEAPFTGAGRERIAEVRRRVLEGAYGSAAVAGRVAEAILRSGDL